MQNTGKRQKPHYTIIEKTKRISRFIYYKIVRIQASPQMIARGCAIGMFFGVMPLIPIQTVLALFFAMASSSSKTAAALCTLITNPVTIFPMYFCYYKIGSLIIPLNSSFSLSHFNILELIKHSPDLFKVMVLGGFILAVPSAIATYFIILRLIHGYQLRRQAFITKRELKKMEELRNSLK